MRYEPTVLLWLAGSWLALAPLSVRAQAPLAPPPPLPVGILSPPSATMDVPKLQLATSTFDFGKVAVGTIVRATFVLTNVGTAPLEITDVRPGCGCTTAGTWERRVEPGKTATIPLQLNTANFGGPVMKNATLTCNDPTQPTVMLMIKGEIWKPIDVQPNFVVFNSGPVPASNDVRVVRVINNTEEMLTVEEPASSIPSFKPTLKVVKPGKEFEIAITVVPPLASGTVQGMITAKTSSTNLPQLTVTALAIVQPAVVPTPGQVMLPAGPLTTPVQMTVTIRNSAAEPITVNNPSVTLSNVTVNLSEVQAGRVYNVALSFPAGFQMAPGQPGQLVVATSNPQTPQITVPIIQMMAPPPPQPWPPQAAPGAGMPPPPTVLPRPARFAPGMHPVGVAPPPVPPTR